MGKTCSCAAILLTVVCALLRLEAGRAAEAAVTLARVAGSVESLHADETGGEWIEALPGDELGAGWELRTGPDGKAQLLFPHDNVVILRENSYLVVRGIDGGGGAQLESNRGGLLVDLRNKLDAGSEFTVETGVAQAVVRGTKFGIDFVPGWKQGARGRVRFFGYAGRVRIRNERGESELAADDELEAVPDAAPGRGQHAPERGRDFLRRLENNAAFEKFEREHPRLDDAIRRRDARRTAARQHKAKHKPAGKRRTEPAEPQNQGSQRGRSAGKG
jgi:hypothetical protein